MKFFHSVLLVIQWIAFVGGLLGAPVLLYTHESIHALAALAVSMSALSALKVEVFSFVAPRR